MPAETADLKPDKILINYDLTLQLDRPSLTHEVRPSSTRTAFSFSTPNELVFITSTLAIFFFFF